MKKRRWSAVLNNSDSNGGGMIWTDLIEEFPDEGYIHPLHDGKGCDGRKYRPVWHATQGSLSAEGDQ